MTHIIALYIEYLLVPILFVFCAFAARHAFIGSSVWPISHSNLLRFEVAFGMHLGVLLLAINVYAKEAEGLEPFSSLAFFFVVAFVVLILPCLIVIWLGGRWKDTRDRKLRKYVEWYLLWTFTLIYSAIYIKYLFSHSSYSVVGSVAFVSFYAAVVVAYQKFFPIPERMNVKYVNMNRKYRTRLNLDRKNHNGSSNIKLVKKYCRFLMRHRNKSYIGIPERNSIRMNICEKYLENEMLDELEEFLPRYQMFFGNHQEELKNYEEAYHRMVAKIKTRLNGVQ